MMRSYERHALGALLFLVSRSEPVSPDNCSLSVETRRGAATAFVHRGSLYSSSNASIATGATAVCTLYCCCYWYYCQAAQLVFGI